MQNQPLYDFFTAQCRSKGVRIESLPKLCGFSRSTLYRYMKGINLIGREMEETFADILGMSAEEREEFHRLIQLTQFDDSLIQARSQLDRFVFGGPGEEGEDSSQFAYYNGEKYLRTLEELLDAACANAGKPGFFCTVQIIDCVEAPVLKHIADFLQRLDDEGAPMEIEHLVSFAQGDHLRNTQVFTSLLTLLPMANLDSYAAHFCMDVQGHALFRNTVLLRASWQEGTGTAQEHYWISLDSQPLETAYRFVDEYLYAFLQDNFAALKRHYTPLLCTANQINLFSLTMLDLVEDAKCILIKPNNCFDKIPYDVYESLVPRCPEALWNALSTLGGGNGSAEQTAREYLEYLGARIQATYDNEHIDVYSTAGLEELVRTGRITDHLEGMPPFSKEELRRILDYVRGRSADPDDSYKLYLCDKPVFENGLILLVMEHKGIMVEFNRNLYQKGTVHSVFVQNQELESVFIDYVQNHIPVNHALSEEEAGAFIDGLIARYLS